MKLDSLQSLVHTVTFQSRWPTARWQAIGLSWLLAADTGTQRMKHSSTLELDLTHMTPFVAASMLRWVYTDSVVLPSEQSAIIELLGASNMYHLTHLKEK